MLLRLVCGDEGVLRADQPGLLLGVEGVGLLGAHQPGPLGGQPCLLRGAPAAVYDEMIYPMFYCRYVDLPRLAVFCAENILS